MSEFQPTDIYEEDVVSKHREEDIQHITVETTDGDRAITLFDELLFAGTEKVAYDDRIVNTFAFKVESDTPEEFMRDVECTYGYHHDPDGLSVFTVSFNEQGTFFGGGKFREFVDVVKGELDAIDYVFFCEPDDYPNCDCESYHTLSYVQDVNAGLITELESILDIAESDERD